MLPALKKKKVVTRFNRNPFSSPTWWKGEDEVINDYCQHTIDNASPESLSSFCRLTVLGWNLWDLLIEDQINSYSLSGEWRDIKFSGFKIYEDGTINYYSLNVSFQDPQFAIFKFELSNLSPDSVEPELKIKGVMRREFKISSCYKWKCMYTEIFDWSFQGKYVLMS